MCRAWKQTIESTRDPLILFFNETDNIYIHAARNSVNKIELYLIFATMNRLEIY